LIYPARKRSYTYPEMKNAQIADIFAGIADLLEILEADRFRINSYRKAARVLEELTEPIEQVAAAGRLQSIAGVGKSTAEKIDQFLMTGKVALHKELLSKVPPGLPELLTVPGLGPKSVSKLWKQGGVTSLGGLKEALQTQPGRLMRIEGMGDKKARQILESMLFLESSAGRVLLGEADESAASLIQAVMNSKGARRVVTAGSLRRGKETIGDIDLLCEAPKTAAAKIIEDFARAPNVRRTLSAGETKGSVVLDREIQADLRVVPKRSFGAALAYFTGSKAHNIRMRELALKKGMKLNEYGLLKGGKQLAGTDEQGIYAALDLPFIPPELREDRGEIEAAAEGKLPDLIDLRDILGDLHVHTVASDGANTIEEMIAACRARGYKYLAICDHSKSQVQAHGLDEKRLIAHAKAIRQAAGKFDDILVLRGIEVDIFKDGSLDFCSEVLAGLDFVTASAHSALSLGRREASRRLIRAIEHPHVHCIGHPSGRLINARQGMELDIDAIATAAAANNTALEINAQYMRLDLRDTHVRAAIRAGAKIIISTDAHSIDQLDMMRYGVATARRGWVRSKDVINTYTPKQLTKWLKKN